MNAFLFVELDAEALHLHREIISQFPWPSIHERSRTEINRRRAANAVCDTHRDLPSAVAPPLLLVLLLAEPCTACHDQIARSAVAVVV